MKNILFGLLISCSVPIFAQNGITFKVEKLSKPEELLHLNSQDDIYKSLILSYMNIEPYEIKRSISKFLIISLQRANLLTVWYLLVLILFQRYVSGLCRSQAICSVPRHDLATNQPGICPAYKCQSGIDEK